MIFIDRSLPKSIARALQLVRNDVKWLEDVYTHDTKDPVWLKDAGDQGWLVIMRDKRILTRPGERAALLDNNVGAFYLTHTGNPNRWEILKLIVGALDEMEEVFASEDRPFLYGLDRNGTLSRKTLSR